MCLLAENEFAAYRRKKINALRGKQCLLVSVFVTN
jgi:hypothetical protein